MEKDGTVVGEKINRPKMQVIIDRFMAEDVC